MTSKPVRSKSRTKPQSVATPPDRPIRFRSAAPDDPIYSEGWTVFTPQGFRKPSDLPRKPARRKEAARDEK